jgi:hypothetical protein
MGRSRNLANLASSIDGLGTLTADGISSTVSLGLSTYDSVGLLPMSGLSAGDQAFVGDRLYISNGSGWFNVGLVNIAPTIITGPNGATYELDSAGGSAISISLTAIDSDGTPVIWSYSTTDSAYDLATITNDSDGTFTVAGKSLADLLSAGYDSTGGSFTINFKVSDGISFDTDTASFSLTYYVEPAISGGTVLNLIYDGGKQYYANNYACGCVLSPDGTRFALSVFNYSTVQYYLRTYALSTPYDVTGNWTSVSSRIVSYSNIGSMDYKPDGYKLYVPDYGTIGRFYEYSLTTPFDAATGSSATVTLTGSLAEPRGVKWNDDGTEVTFMMTNMLYTYSVNTPYSFTGGSISDVATTAALRQASPPTNSTGFDFSPDGKKIYFSNAGTDQIQEFDLSTAYDITTMFNFRTWNVASNGGDNLRGICATKDGNRLVCGQWNSTLDVRSFSFYDMPEAPATITSYSNIIQADVFGQIDDSGVTGICWANSGQYLFVAAYNGGAEGDETIRRYSTSTPYDIASLTLDQTFDADAFPTTSLTYPAQLQCIDVSDDGLTITCGAYLTGSYDTRTIRYNLNTAYDLTDMGSAQAYNNYCEDIHWRKDGTNRGRQGIRLLRQSSQTYLMSFTTTTGRYDFGYYSQTNLLNITSVVNDDAYSLAVSSDGTQVYVVDRILNRIHQWTLPTAWTTMSTATYNGYYQAKGIWATGAFSLEFGDDDKRLHLASMSGNPDIAELWGI